MGPRNGSTKTENVRKGWKGRSDWRVGKTSLETYKVEEVEERLYPRVVGVVRGTMDRDHVQPVGSPGDGRVGRVSSRIRFEFRVEETQRKGLVLRFTHVERDRDLKTWWLNDL